MHFQAIATSAQGFADWIKQAKASSSALTADTYAALAKPSERNPVAYYGSVTPTMFNDIINKYMVAPHAHGMQMTDTSSMSMSDMHMPTQAKAAE
jgi:cytochrome o ubiquinol oxidase subunit 2